MESVQRERTYIMIKPDGVQRGLIGVIMQRFEQKGFKLVAMKLAQPGKAKFEEHYADLSKKPFFGVSLIMPLLVQFAACAGKETTLLRPEEKCLVPLSHLTPSQELLEVISALMSEEISST